MTKRHDGHGRLQMGTAMLVTRHLHTETGPWWLSAYCTIHLEKYAQGFPLCCVMLWLGAKRFNTLRPRQNGRHFADDTFNRIFLNENVLISINISLKFVPRGPINNISALVQIMAWRRPGDKPLSEPMMVRLPTHICVTRPQWVKPTTRLSYTPISFMENMVVTQALSSSMTALVTA